MGRPTAFAELPLLPVVTAPSLSLLNNYLLLGGREGGGRRASRHSLISCTLLWFCSFILNKKNTLLYDLHVDGKGRGCFRTRVNTVINVTNKLLH